MRDAQTDWQKTFALTGLALLAFAGNSVLARLALADGAIGAGLFTALRIFSGAAVLLILVGARPAKAEGSWRGAASLLGYAGLFSVAYLTLSTGTGALILFASVQITMIGWGLIRGERLNVIQSGGVFLAGAGLVWLLAPGLARPDPLAALMMIGSGVCWGAYSLLGRGAGRPTQVTAGNFLRATVLGLPLLGLWLAFAPAEPVSVYGVALAIASGALTSGLGYAVWYRALKGLSASRAGIVQLLVPPLAALGGIMILHEPLTVRFIGASAIILIGIALAIFRPVRSD
jgi:drug/metabolite transporter (DMT)-like permease